MQQSFLHIFLIHQFKEPMKMQLSDIYQNLKNAFLLK
jgi:hypothetical protein